MELLFPEALPHGHQASCWHPGRESVTGERLGVCVRSPVKAACYCPTRSLSLVLLPIPSLSPLPAHPGLPGPPPSAALRGHVGSLYAAWQPRAPPSLQHFPSVADVSWRCQGTRVSDRYKVVVPSAVSPQGPSPARRPVHSPGCRGRWCLHLQTSFPLLAFLGLRSLALGTGQSAGSMIIRE